MHTIDLLSAAMESGTASSLHEIPSNIKIEKGMCCVTGEYTDTIPRKKILGTSFCDANLFVAPDSNRIGVKVWQVFMFGEPSPGKKRIKKPEMQACWFCDRNRFVEVKKPAIRKIVLKGVNDKAWACWVTTSYKKHGSLRSPVNKKKFGRIGFDEIIVDTDTPLRTEIWTKLREAQNIGIGKPALKALDMPIGFIGKIGVKVWLEYKSWALSLYQSSLYKLLWELLPSQAELKEGIEL
jgi:hypothetical protein